jgi:hypothetical protein
MVYGLPSQTGNLQQWINNTTGGTVLASVASDGAFRIQPNSTGIASLVSTTHPFQIGQTSATNLRMDTNQILAVNNGAASDLYVNTYGGNVYVGNTSSPGDVVLGNSATSVSGALIFKAGTGGSLRAFSSTSGNTSMAIKNSDGTAFSPLVASGFYPGGQGSANLNHDGTKFTMNDTVAVTGAITATTSITATGAINGSNQASYVRSDSSTASTTSIPAGSFQSHSLTWTSTVSTPVVVASPYMSTASTVMMTAVVYGRSSTAATIYLYNATASATTVGRYALGIAVI